MESGPTVIKIVEPENELKYKNHLHDFEETLCLFSNILENSLRHLKMILYRYNYLVIFLIF